MKVTIQLLGDINNGGGILNNTPNDFVTLNGVLIAVNGSKGTSHDTCPTVPIHCQNNWLTNSDSFVKINNIPISRTNDTDTCGHIRQEANNFVRITQ